MRDVNVEDPREALHDVVVFHSRDWSLNSGDAWLYGIVVGWDDAALTEVVAKHRWPAKDVERLGRLHALFTAGGTACPG